MCTVRFFTMAPAQFVETIIVYGQTSLLVCTYLLAFKIRHIFPCYCSPFHMISNQVNWLICKRKSEKVFALRFQNFAHVKEIFKSVSCHACPHHVHPLPTHAPCRTCPLPHACPHHTCPLPCMNPLPCMPPPHMPPVMHTPLPHMPPAMHAPHHACPPAMHVPPHARPSPLNRITDACGCAR